MIDALQYLTGQFLISMPSMQNEAFEQTVTLVCQHSADGAFGLIVNRPLDYQLGDMFQQLNIDYETPAFDKMAIHEGGPVQPEVGMILHNGRGDWQSTIEINGDLSLTTSQDILGDIANDNGPNKFQVSLGYAGWGPNQLESEMLENAWLTTPLSLEIIFDTPMEKRWQAAANLIGIDIHQLSSSVGHA